MIIMIFVYSVCSLAELQRFEHSAKSDGSLSFLVVGDWGRRGLENQSEVALQVLNLYILSPVNARCI